MSRPAKGARLWLEPAEIGRDGKVVRHASWVIRDGPRKVRTGRARKDRAGAEQDLAEYIGAKYQPSRDGGRHPAQVLVLDVLNIYLARQGGQAREAGGNEAANLDARRLLATLYARRRERSALPRVCRMAGRASHGSPPTRTIRGARRGSSPRRPRAGSSRNFGPRSTIIARKVFALRSYASRSLKSRRRGRGG